MSTWTQPRRTVAENQVGAIDDLDLYHDYYSATDVLRPDGASSIFVDPRGTTTSEKAAYGLCSDLTGPSPSANTANSFLVLTVGVPFCFVTSAGHVAWGTTEGIQNSGEVGGRPRSCVEEGCLKLILTRSLVLGG